MISQTSVDIAWDSFRKIPKKTHDIFLVTIFDEVVYSQERRELLNNVLEYDCNV